MTLEIRNTPPSSPSALLALLAFFGVLWAPLEYRPFLEMHWMKIGAFVAPLVVFVGCIAGERNTGPWKHDERLLACLLTAAYLLHQIEEHWVDLLGREYPLHELLNELLASALGSEADGAMTPAAIFFINTTLVWLTGFLAIWRGRGFGIDALAGVVMVNGVAHVAQAVATGQYNPGLTSGSVLFLPLALVAAHWRLQGATTTPARLALGAAWGVGAHALLVAGVVAANVRGIVPVTAFYASLVAWGAVPALLSNSHPHSEGD